MKDFPEQIDSNVARSTAAFTFLVTLTFIFTPLKWIIFPLALDFYIRGFLTPEYSPLAILAKYIVKKFNVKEDLIFAPPKIFAAKIGFTVSIIAFVSYLSGYTITAYLFIFILGVFSFAEAFLNYCVGCLLHSYWEKLRK